MHHGVASESFLLSKGAAAEWKTSADWIDVHAGGQHHGRRRLRGALNAKNADIKGQRRDFYEWKSLIAINGIDKCMKRKKNTVDPVFGTFCHLCGMARVFHWTCWSGTHLFGLSRTGSATLWRTGVLVFLALFTRLLWLTQSIHHQTRKHIDMINIFWKQPMLTVICFSCSINADRAIPRMLDASVNRIAKHSSLG